MKPKFCVSLAAIAVILGGSVCFDDTSYGQTGNELRVVGGQLYNAQQSVLFKTIEAEVRAVNTNGVLFNWKLKKPIYGKAPPSDSLVSGGIFWVQHQVKL